MNWICGLQVELTPTPVSFGGYIYESGLANQSISNTQAKVIGLDTNSWLKSKKLAQLLFDLPKSMFPLILVKLKMNQ